MDFVFYDITVGVLASMIASGLIFALSRFVKRTKEKRCSSQSKDKHR